MVPAEHNCAWRQEAEKLAGCMMQQQSELEKLAEAFKDLQGRYNDLKEENQKLKTRLFKQGRRRTPTPEQEREKKTPPTAEEKAERSRRADEKRRKNREKLKALETITIEHSVPENERLCADCGELAEPIGKPQSTISFEYKPGTFIRTEHFLQSVKCKCGKHMARAEGPQRVFDKGRYGPGFIAHLIISKCADAIPINRITTQFARVGIPMSRATMNELFLRAADELEPIYKRLMAMLCVAWVVQADETSVLVHALKKKGYVWTFLTSEIVLFTFAMSRSGMTPVKVLGESQGVLVVDGYSGYNVVTTPDGRWRAGCWSHARCGFYEALPHAPQAQEVIDLILELFIVESDAQKRDIVGTSEHHQLRQERSAPVLKKIKAWCERNAAIIRPSSELGKAIGYALNQWKSLELFLTDPRIPIHNNTSERVLRSPARGRNNYWWYGTAESGQQIAILHTLIATCEANGVNPFEYLKDVLLRIQRHPASRLDELLPQNWVPPEKPPPDQEISA